MYCYNFSFSFPDNYPSVPPVFEIEANQSGSFTFRDADHLFDLFMVESLKRVGQMMVFDLVSLAQEHLSGGYAGVCERGRGREI